MSPSEPLLSDRRENWGSRTGFILAAIGSAVGLGNLWGFPYKVYDNGGGAFLIPYVIAMVLIGIPVLILEFSLGHMTQRAAPDAYRGINRRTEPIGWWGILLGFIIITYYPVILAYCGSFLVECVKGIVQGGQLPWAGKGMEGVVKAGKHFEQTYLQSWTAGELGGEVKSWSLGHLVKPITISLGVIWVLMYLCIFRGVKMVSKVVLFTVPLPWIMLLVLTVRGLTLEGAEQGLAYYLNPNWDELGKPETWRWAFGQMFFSMSLAFGVMVTYASFLHRKSDINNNASIIGLADVGTSFIAGIAVFATLGGMAYATQQAAILQGNPELALEVQSVVKGGPGLVFVAFPYALAQLPYSAWFGAVFFIALLTLGIDSAFSITESVLASLVDKTGWKRGWVLIGMTLAGFAAGLIYCTRGGLNWLGAIDDFINSSWGGIALLGLLECVVLGWSYRIGRLREHANELSDWKVGRWWDALIRYFAPLVLSALFAWSLTEKASASGGFLHDDAGALNVPVLVGLLVAVFVPVLSVILSMISSPGADTHAQHVGQPRLGRIGGVVGLLLVALSLVGVVLVFNLARSAKLYGGLNLPAARMLGPLVLGISAGLSLVGVIVGSVLVHRAEATDHRPSSLARSAAGVGVMLLGACGGLAMFLWMLLRETGKAPVVTTAQSAAATGKAAVAPSLSTGAYVMLTVMSVIIVAGLGWCFYRALRASGASDAEQTSEV